MLQLSIVSIAISFIIFACGFFFVDRSNTEEYMKIGGGGVVLVIAIQLIVSFAILNPSSTLNYQGMLEDKEHRVHYRTETYKCGNSQCTRQVREDHYYLIIRIFDNIKKEREVSYSTYRDAVINTPYVYDDSVINYFLFKKDVFETSESVREQYKQIVPKRPEVFDIGQYKRIVDLDSFGNVKRFTPELENSLLHFLMKKPYDIKIIVTNEAFDSGFYDALLDKWHGAAPTEIILTYGIDNQGVVQWSKLETFAQNDSNHKLVADFSTNHMGDNDKLDTKLVMKDIDFVLKDYVAVSPNEQRFVELQKTASQSELNVILIVSAIIQLLIIVFVSRIM